MDSLLQGRGKEGAQEAFDDFREELAEEAPSALEVLEGGLKEATAVLALPGKYRRRLRTTKRDPSGLSRRSGGGKNRFGSFQAVFPVNLAIFGHINAQIGHVRPPVGS